LGKRAFSLGITLPFLGKLTLLNPCKFGSDSLSTQLRTATSSFKHILWGKLGLLPLLEGFFGVPIFEIFPDANYSRKGHFILKGFLSLGFHWVPHFSRTTFSTNNGFLGSPFKLLFSLGHQRKVFLWKCFDPIGGPFYITPNGGRWGQNFTGEYAQVLYPGHGVAPGFSAGETFFPPPILGGFSKYFRAGLYHEGPQGF